MPGSTGPDLISYSIPEVELGDTFNYWRDTTNTTIYKLNKLRVYDFLDSNSIGVTYGSTGGWRGFIQETVTTGHTFTSLLRLSGGLSASYLLVGTGTTIGGNLTVNGGVTFASVLTVSGYSTFLTGISAGTLVVNRGSTFSDNVNIGVNTVGVSLGISGSVNLLRQGGIRFYDADDSNYVGFKAPATVSPTNIIWTLPATDGSNGHVLSTNSSGILSWKAADGVTGTDTQVQYNQGGAPGATSSFLFHYSSSAGYSAGTLGVSGGAYFFGNVGIGVTGQNIGGRIIHGSGANTSKGKLEVVGDIEIKTAGFFVTSNITVPAGVCGYIAANENAITSGTLTVASGATLTVESGSTLVIL